MNRKIYAYDDDDNLLGSFRYSRKRSSPHRRWKERMRNLGAVVFETAGDIHGFPVIAKSEAPKVRKPTNTAPIREQKILKRITQLQTEIELLKDLLSQ